MLEPGLFPATDAEGRPLFKENGEPNHDVTVPLWAAGKLGSAGQLDCFWCGQDTSTNGLAEVYSVKDAVWVIEAQLDPHLGCLCIGCLEARLGRELTPSDFDQVPMNAVNIRRSLRLQARMGLL